MLSKSSRNEVNTLASRGIKPLSRATNYSKWRHVVIDILAEKGYWGIVSGKSESPDKTPAAASADSNTPPAAAVAIPSAARTTQSAATEKWELKSSKSQGMPGRLLDSAYRELYTDVRDPKELWDNLEK